MEKLKVALVSAVESLINMAVALITMVSANYMKDMVAPWMAVAYVLGMCALIAVINYFGKTCGYGFFVTKEEDDE